MPAAIQATSERMARSIAATSRNEFTLCSRAGLGDAHAGEGDVRRSASSAARSCVDLLSVTPGRLAVHQEALTWPSATSRAKTASTSAGDGAADPALGAVQDPGFAVRRPDAAFPCGQSWPVRRRCPSRIRLGQREDALEREVDDPRASSSACLFRGGRRPGWRSGTARPGPCTRWPARRPCGRVRRSGSPGRCPGPCLPRTRAPISSAGSIRSRSIRGRASWSGNSPRSQYSASERAGLRVQERPQPAQHGRSASVRRDPAS